MAYVPNRSTPVIVQIRDALECIAGMLQATGNIIFGANAADTKTLDVYGETFEFLLDLDDLTEGNIGVQIGDDATATRNNLIIALAELPRSNPDIPLVMATPITSEGDPGISLKYWEAGTVGNNLITTNDANIDVSGMADGVDGGIVKVEVIV